VRLPEEDALGLRGLFFDSSWGGAVCVDDVIGGGREAVASPWWIKLEGL
jgi:hypothetical protein